MSWKALSHLTSHLLDEKPFRALKKGVRQSEYLDMNLFNAASFPIMACICFLVLGDCIYRTTQACTGAILIQHLLIRTPRNFLYSTRRRIYHDSVVDGVTSLIRKASRKWARMSLWDFDFRTCRLYILPSFSPTKV